MEIQEGMKVYLSGAISGDPEFAENFAAWETYLSGGGLLALSPARHPPGMTPEEYMDINFAMIRSADFVAMLPGWEKSPGAGLELHYCKYCHKPVFNLSKKEWIS